jgi:hypothetical protein
MKRFVEGGGRREYLQGVGTEKPVVLNTGSFGGVYALGFER